eukprot:CAMPEP_0171473164 /NCGR_PEP_ID=MMETSP0946-20130122/1685_1 /TAXON_ID=109269 /ORGANISM="Vaucheria litorea, Strain CCMP2940" /LENGTH=174 /DNA_ID=CAMNT_0012002889 /DNA_START=195 /DNA_END=715 /DNA_ORIENTATION=+
MKCSNTVDAKRQCSDEFQGNPRKNKEMKVEHKNYEPSCGDNLISSMTNSEIKEHLDSLKSELFENSIKVKLKCSPLLKKLMEHEYGWIFNQPVDPLELNLPDYLTVIKTPMDLGTIKKKLESGGYQTYESFSSDCLLTFNNAIRYNEEGSEVNNIARQLKKILEDEFSKLMDEV